MKEQNNVGLEERTNSFQNAGPVPGMRYRDIAVLNVITATSLQHLFLKNTFQFFVETVLIILLVILSFVERDSTRAI